ncbi:MAG: polymer-forming cytoskeletal protein [Coriobacteriia bacterium]|nr:polymer-forming cytoskeletal protein [Coriobacteriia bacterium]
MAENMADARINGDGTVGAGTYGSIVLNGAGTVTGDVACNELTVNGVGKCQGSVKADTITVNGAGTFDGPVQAGEFRANGSADVHAGMGVRLLKVAGTLAVDGGVAAHAVELKGDMRVGGDLESDTLTGEGRFAINGMLNAGSIELRLHGRSSVNEIGCERMVLRPPDGITAIFSAFADRRLVATTIEGDELELIATTAKVVRGGRVTLGEGCEVDLVEYTGSLTKLAGAQVREERKVEAAG